MRRFLGGIRLLIAVGIVVALAYLIVVAHI
jgi:hypothetical protein